MTVGGIFMVCLGLVLGYGVLRGCWRLFHPEAFGELVSPPEERSFKLPSEEAEEREKRAKPLL